MLAGLEPLWLCPEIDLHREFRPEYLSKNLERVLPENPIGPAFNGAWLLEHSKLAPSIEAAHGRKSLQPLDAWADTYHPALPHWSLHMRTCICYKYPQHFQVTVHQLLQLLASVC